MDSRITNQLTLESPVTDLAGNPVDIHKTLEELNLSPLEVMFGVTPSEWKHEVRFEFDVES